MEKPKVNGIYQHKKGNRYLILGIGFHSETEEEMVIYMGKDFRIWLRPLTMFMDPGRFTFVRMSHPYGWNAFK